ncbi:MAG: SDH family Clp fold serine proteinase [Candidatus Heimdallarchaeaceae archaeon]
MSFHKLFFEINEEEKKGIKSIDKRITDSLEEISKKTERDTLLYATRWSFPKEKISPEYVSMLEEDIFYIVDLAKELTSENLDFILHSPGGSLEVAEFIAKYFRTRFKHIRVIIPQGAMSAAVVLACTSDIIIMGNHSYIGPIDPQILISTPLGTRLSPSHAILEQYKKIKKDYSENPSETEILFSMMEQYGPEMIEICSKSIELTNSITADFLERYMFKDDTNPQKRSADVAKKLIDYSKHKTHKRHITREEAKEYGLIIEDMEEDTELYELYMNAFNLIMLAFILSNTTKIYANNLGNKIVKKGPKN